MIYKAKEGSKAYEYIRNILETEEKERNAYFNRVNEAVGFKVMKYGGYRQMVLLTEHVKSPVS